MTIFIPGVLNKWDSLKTNDGDTAVKMQGPSIGFLCAYATYEDCKAEFPNRDVIEMESISRIEQTGTTPWHQA